MHLAPTILRRALVTATLCAVFWFTVTPIRQNIGSTLLTISSFLLVGLIVGLFMTWPRPVWARVVIFLAFAILIGLRNEPMHPHRPFAKAVTALVTVAPLGILLLVILGVDWLVVRVVEGRKPPTEGSPPQSTS
ncbi:MAG TPA: hypothetical protein VGR02_09075 [Thermoanaerobaculia bacterium]|jgi:hypothetical protein|nr:hypothetical protein [Thermoanaerobaculia bacterium]